MSYSAESPLPSFEYQGLPTRVIFGSGTRSSTADEAERLNMRRALILYGPVHTDVAAQLRERLGARAASEFAGATMHTPTSVTEEALTIVEAMKIDGVVAIGGGSMTGLSKAIALRTDLPQIILPTTYAGSEMTPILGETSDGLKTTVRSAKVLPETVIYDVDLTIDLPVKLSGVSGMNALAHSVEALYARDRNPVISALAIESICALARALPAIRLEASDKVARSDALYGAWLAGICLGSVEMALHHKLCHTLGGMFNLPHAETHAIILPHVLAYNASALPAVTQRLNNALNVTDSARALYMLNKASGGPLALSEIGMPESGINHAADLAIMNPYWNPRPVDRGEVFDLLKNAYFGKSPNLTRVS
ncbi:MULTISPECIES: maleylacetate reductase [Burkholderia]|uniref:maleylacetate reductase n=1 Tax=Burkholderia TaxID=32008 RepID=UPI0007056C96|nr:MULTISPECIES: maleylacetate reductase [Burkholderia]ALK30092.1 maleylacetate reductase [Burkholderia plantarii]GLZ23184.1 maleylacetate reductase [Burkholderia plantarii]